MARNGPKFSTHLVFVWLIVHAMACFAPSPNDGLECSESQSCPPSQHCDVTRLECLPRPTGVAAIAAGGEHTCALLNTGNVRCWGSKRTHGISRYGGAIGDDEVPKTVGEVHLGASVDVLDAGSFFSCAVTRTGAVRCWGGGAEGVLGYGDTLAVGLDEDPIEAGEVSLGQGQQDMSVIAISSSHKRTCVVGATGGLQCWGNGGAPLGYGPGSEDDVGDDELPREKGFVQLRSAAISVAVGARFACAVVSEDGFRCWGDDVNIGVRSQHIGDDEGPGEGPLVELQIPIVELAAGWNHACVLLRGGTVRCWGSNAEGQLGYGHLNELLDVTMAESVPVGGVVTQLALGNAFSCALLEEGQVRCWGRAGSGQLGYGTLVGVGGDTTPAEAGDVPLGGPAVRISAGDAHVCAVMHTGSVRCWGDNEHGQLGYASVALVGDDETPASVGDVELY